MTIVAGATAAGMLLHPIYLQAVKTREMPQQPPAAGFKSGSLACCLPVDTF
jgi:hypothetical protein